MVQRWLVTVAASADLDAVEAVLKGLGCSEVDTGLAVPLGDDEQAIPVVGPDDLPARSRRPEAVDIVSVYPDSDIELL